MDKLLQGLSLSNDITYELEYIKGYLPVHNHQQSYDVSNKQQMIYIYDLMNQT